MFVDYYVPRIAYCSNKNTETMVKGMSILVVKTDKLWFIIVRWGDIINEGSRSEVKNKMLDNKY